MNNELFEQISAINTLLTKANESGTGMRIEAFGASDHDLLDQIEEAQNELNSRMMVLMAAKNDLTGLKFTLQQRLDESISA